MQDLTLELPHLKVIVTGAAKGMGAYFARRLAEHGAAVVAADVDEAGLGQLPKNVHRCVADVASEADCRRLVESAHAQLGGLNALINNAGILKDGLLVRKSRSTGVVSTLSLADWNAVLAVNLTGATLMVREVVAKMLATDAGPGVIVNMSSVSRHGNRGQSSYVAAKSALAANTVTWAREFAPYGIRVGAVAPGMIETPMTAAMKPAAREALVETVPLGRIGQPEDIWRAIRFVIECEYFTGETIDVDGGLKM